MKIRVYVGCTLATASENYIKCIDSIKEFIRLHYRDEIEVMDFYGRGGGVNNDRDVYMRDIHFCVKFCHIMIAECSYPSTGLGWELGTAIEHRHIPVLKLVDKNAKISRLVRGSDGGVTEYVLGEIPAQEIHSFINTYKRNPAFYIHRLITDFSFILHKIIMFGRRITKRRV